MAARKIIKKLEPLEKKEENFDFIKHCLRGLVIIALVAFLGFSVIRYFYPTFGQSSHIESTYQVPSDYLIYKNENMFISSLTYPQNWNLTEGVNGEQSLILEADDRPSNITASLVTLDKGQSIDYRAYTYNLAKLLKTNPSISFEKTGENLETMNGKEWLVYDSIMTLNDSGEVYYNRTAILKTGKKGGREYFHFLLESDKDHLAEDIQTFNNVIRSLRYYY